MNWYVRVWARPLGAEPKVFKTLNEATIKCDCPEYPGCSPWCEPSIREFDNELSAWRWIKENYPMAYLEKKDYPETFKGYKWEKK